MTTLEVVGVVALVVLALEGALLFIGWRAAKRREATVIPQPLPVVRFRPGQRLSPGDVSHLEEQLQRQRDLGRALRGKRWTPTPQVRA